MDLQTNRQINKWTNEKMDIQTIRQMDKWSNAEMHKQTYKLMEKLTNEDNEENKYISNIILPLFDYFVLLYLITLCCFM